VPTVAQVAAVGSIPAKITSWHDFGVGGFFVLGMTALYFLCFLAWFGSMGFFIHSLVSPELRMETQFFRFSLVYPVVYVPIFYFLVILGSRVPVDWVILPLHLVCTVCLFYLLYFVSKNLALAETGKTASFYEYAAPFFLLCFFPLGCGLSSRGSIGCTQAKTAQKHSPRLTSPSPDELADRKVGSSPLCAEMRRNKTKIALENGAFWKALWNQATRGVLPSTV